MKVMISLPMDGVSDEEIKQQMTDIRVQFEAAGHEVVNSLLDLRIDGYKNVPLLYLGASIQIISDVDAVYFAPGWDKARGCKIERQVCEAYGVQIIDTIPKPITRLIFDIEKLEVGDTVIFYNGTHVYVKRISKCPCGQCEIYYINDHISTNYDTIQYIIKKEEK